MKKINKFILRIRVAWSVLFIYDHFFIINLKRTELIRSFKGEDFDAEGYRVGLQPYNQQMIIKTMGENIDEDSLVLMKAEFEAMAEMNYGTI